MVFLYENNHWWELDKEKLTVYNYMGGYHNIDAATLKNVETFECKNWHELYLAKHFCPFMSDVSIRNGWISPEGIIYEATAHEVTAEYLLDIIYGVESMWPGDELELKGWVRVTTSLMWNIRLDKLKEKQLTQKQFDAVWDWCFYHKMTFPYSKED